MVSPSPPLARVPGGRSAPGVNTEPSSFPPERTRRRRGVRNVRGSFGHLTALVWASLLAGLWASSSSSCRTADATRASAGIAPSLPEVLPAVAARRGADGDDGADGRDDERVSRRSLVSDRPVGEDDAASPARGDETGSREGDSGDDDDDVEGGEWRKSLPAQLQKRRGTLHRLLVPTGRGGGGGDGDGDVCEVYLLGTSHVSKDSCVDARLLMEHVRPDVLFVELCHQRLALLSDETAPPAAADPRDGAEGTEKGDGGAAAAAAATAQAGGEAQSSDSGGMSRTSAWSASMLTRIQSDYATKLGVTIGGEFRESFRQAKVQQRQFEEEMNRRRWGIAVGPPPTDVHPCTVILGDRPVRLTLLRAWESLSVLGKAKLIVGLIWSTLRQPSEKELKEWMDSIINDPNNDLLTKSIEELSQHFPTIGETIINERDRFMVGKLKQTVRLLGDVQHGRPRKKIVAVVGAGHCPGMCRLFSERDDTSLGNNVEDMLRSLVETKRWKAETNDEIRSLTTDVTELQAR